MVFDRFSVLNFYIKKNKLDVILFITLSFSVCYVFTELSLFDYLATFFQPHKLLESNQDLFFFLILLCSLSYFSLRCLNKVKRTNKDKEKAEKELHYLQFHDALTGLPNNAFLQQKIVHAMRHTHTETPQFTLLLVDLNQFKKINAIHGHHVGSQILKEVAKRLTNILGAKALCARSGCDEFTILFAEKMSQVHIIEHAKMIIQSLQKPIKIAENIIDVRCCIGIVVDDLKKNVTHLLRKADIAMYAAKLDPNHNFKFFDGEMEQALFEREFIEVELAKAVKNKALDVYFQPIFDINDHRKVQYFEVLARWQHPEKGMISPDIFIEIAEENRLINELGYDILEKACSIAMTWSHPYPIAVNVSAHQLHDPHFIQHVKGVLDKTQLPAERLEIELTESVLLEDVALAQKTIKALKALNVLIALDDFGSGYSSIAYIREYEFDKIKIDRDIIKGIKKSDKNRVIVEALIYVCNELSISLVAEGIETEETLNYLKNKNIDYGQGFLLGVPQNEQKTQSCYGKI